MVIVACICWRVWVYFFRFQVPFLHCAFDLRHKADLKDECLSRGHYLLRIITALFQTAGGPRSPPLYCTHAILFRLLRLASPRSPRAWFDSKDLRYFIYLFIIHTAHGRQFSQRQGVYVTWADFWNENADTCHLDVLISTTDVKISVMKIRDIKCYLHFAHSYHGKCGPVVKGWATCQWLCCVLSFGTPPKTSHSRLLK